MFKDGDTAFMDNPDVDGGIIEGRITSCLPCTSGHKNWWILVEFDKEPDLETSYPFLDWRFYDLSKRMDDMRRYLITDTLTVTMSKNGRPASYRKGTVMTFTHSINKRHYFIDPSKDECWLEDVSLESLVEQGAIKRIDRNAVHSNRPDSMANKAKRRNK